MEHVPNEAYWTTLHMRQSAPEVCEMQNPFLRQCAGHFYNANLNLCLSCHLLQGSGREVAHHETTMVELKNV